MKWSLVNRKTTGHLLALLLAILGLVLWNKGLPQAAEDAQGDGTGQAHPVREGASRPGSAPSKLPRDTGKRTTESVATHSPEELKNFILPEFEARDATLGEALATLFSQYDQICRDTGEAPLRFTYRLEARAPEHLQLHLRQRSFLHVLRAIAAQADLALDHRGTHLVFSEIEETPAQDLATASHPVPPGFLHELNALVSPAPPWPPGEDPFGGKNPVVAPPDTLMENLRRLGIIRSSNATAAHLPSNSTLVLQGSPADLARLETYLQEEYLDKPPVSVRTSIKVIDPPSRRGAFPNRNSRS